MGDETETFNQIVGEDLSGVTFVRDYLQLQFNPPPLLNIYTPTTIHADQSTASYGEPAFANLIIGQINKVVAAVSVDEGECLEIQFEDGSRVVISLRPGHYSGPEAVNLFCKDNRVVVL